MNKKNELMTTAVTNMVSGMITSAVTSIGLGKVFPKATTIRGKLLRGFTISAIAGATAEPCFRTAKDTIDKYNKVSREKEAKKDAKKYLISTTNRNYWDMVSKYNSITADMLIASTLINSLSNEAYDSSEYRVHLHKILHKIHKGICLMSNELNIPLKAAITKEVARFNETYEHMYKDYIKFIRVVEFYLQIDENDQYVDPLKKEEAAKEDKQPKKYMYMKENKKEIKKELSKFNAPGSTDDE